MKKIAVFASGSGTNAEAICRYFEGSDNISVDMLVSNRSKAGAIDRVAKFGVPSFFFPKEEWRSDADGGCNGAHLLPLLGERGIDLIVLAGFLAIIPDGLLSEYEGRIINIHPSLLPKYGGPGMYGDHVHNAVLEAGEKLSGITIHQVTSKVDGGKILLQATCNVEPGDTPDTLAARIHPLEHYFYPRVIEFLLNH